MRALQRWNIRFLLKGLILDCKNDLISDCDRVQTDLEENMDNKRQDVKMIKNLR